MPGLILAAAVTPDNTPAGYILTFAFPVGLFVVIATILYLLFSRPHRRIPDRPVLASALAPAPRPGAARAASVAAGLPTAAGGGTTESHHEPAGAALAADADAGTVSDQGDSPDDAGLVGREAPGTDGTEASE